MDDGDSTPAIRNRGLTVFVDTLQCAEFDIKGYQVSDDSMDRIANRLKSLPFSPEDVVPKVEGMVGLRVRHLEGYDILFSVSRENEGLVVTIAGIMPPEDTSLHERIRTAIDAISTVRGVSGV